MEIDDGLGGTFTELHGSTTSTLALTASKTTGVVMSRYYRVRYSARNVIGFGPVSEIAYILAAQIPDQASVSATLPTT